MRSIPSPAAVDTRVGRSARGAGVGNCPRCHRHTEGCTDICCRGYDGD